MAPLDHGVFRDQAVEPGDSGHRAGEGRRDLRRCRVDDCPGDLARGPDRLQRRAQRSRDHRCRAAHRQKGASGVRGADRQSLSAQRGRDLGHLGRAGAVPRCILRRTHVVPEVRRTRCRDGRHGLGQSGRILPGQDHIEVEHLARRGGAQLGRAGRQTGGGLGQDDPSGQRRSGKTDVPGKRRRAQGQRRCTDHQHCCDAGGSHDRGGPAPHQVHESASLPGFSSPESEPEAEPEAEPEPVPTASRGVGS